MRYGRQEFKKYLIDSMKNSSTLTYGEICEEIKAYALTEDFEISYRKWVFVFRPSYKKEYVKGPVHISEILEKALK